MKIAVYAKESLAANTYKSALVEKLSKAEGFSVMEVSLKQDGAIIDVPSDSDRMLVFGGDGTMLVAAKSTSLPILGINLGNLGFLTELEADTPLGTVVSALKNGYINERIMLKASYNGFQADALNDVTIKSSTARPIVLNLYIDGNFVDSYHSDGVIVCTPTGSTAYSLSAGGPVIEPNVDAFVINPVCPHSLHSRPMVISTNSVIEMSLCGGEGAHVVVDGDVKAVLSDGEKIRIVKSSKTAKFIQVGNENFYARLLKKMNRWGVTK